MSRVAVTWLFRFIPGNVECEREKKKEREREKDEMNERGGLLFIS